MKTRGILFLIVALALALSGLGQCSMTQDRMIITKDLRMKTGPISFGTVKPAGILQGGGTSASPLSLGASGGKGFSYYLNTTSATATDALEGLYVRTYYGASATAVAPQGEAGRFFASLIGDAASGTITGLHASAGLTAGATNTGLTVGSRSNLILPDASIAGAGGAGTFAGAQVEINSGGTSSDLTNCTGGLLRLVIDGSVTASKMAIPIFDINIPAANISNTGSDAILDTDATTNTPTAKLRIRINGVTYWIPVDTADD